MNFSLRAAYLFTQRGRPPEVKFLTLSQKPGSSLSYEAPLSEDNYQRALLLVSLKDRDSDILLPPLKVQLTNVLCHLKLGIMCLMITSL